MRLLSTAEAALAIGAKVNGATVDDDAGLTSIITNLTPRFEDACNTKSLTRQGWTDYFRLSFTAVQDDGHRIALRLANGFLDPAVPVVLVDPAGTETVVAVADRDDEYGIVYIDSCITGLYQVRYTAGFLPTPFAVSDPPPEGYVPPVEASNPLLQNVPDWMKAAVSAYCIQWYRIAVLAPKIPKNERSTQTLVDAIRSEVYARVYSRYQRPRMGVRWSYKTDKQP